MQIDAMVSKITRRTNTERSLAQRTYSQTGLILKKYFTLMFQICDDYLRGPCQLFLLSLFSILLLFGSVALAGERGIVSLVQSQIVFEGDPLELLCKADKPIDWCEFQVPGFGTNIKLYDGVQNPRYEFVGGFHHGECGIRIFSAAGANHGLATCRVSYPRLDQLGEGACNVTVHHLPKDLLLSSNKRIFEFNEGDNMEFNCTGSGGFPPPNITLLYDKKVVAFGTNSPSWSKIAEVSDFDKKIQCIVIHPNETGQQRSSSRIIIVNFSPRVVGKLLEDNVYVAEGNFTVGQNATIKVPISAYPKPELIEWTWASGERLDHKRFMPWPHTEIFYNDTTKEWIFGLDITNLSDGDLSTSFKLIVRNDLDELTTFIKTESTPENDSSNLILIVTLVLLVLVLTVLFIVSSRRQKIMDRSERKSAPDTPNFLCRDKPEPLTHSLT